MTGQERHRWAWDDDPLSGERVGYCESHCGVRWHGDEPEPTGCPGDTRPSTTAQIGPFGWPLKVDPDLSPDAVWITDGDGNPLAIGLMPDDDNGT